jgi:CRP-like cAMP-binding protein
VTNQQTALGNNRLLNFLPEENRARFINYCEVVNLNLGEVISNPGDTIHYIYFPIEGIISWEKQIAGSPYLVVTLVGNEGMLSISLMLGVNNSPCRAVVPELNLQLKRYAFVTYNQLLQTAACNLFHVLENRLARLLLMFQDRSQSDELHVTQEQLAQMLGVRRVGVTKAAGALQRKNLISYSRGDVIIHDSVGLKTASCLCYQADKHTYAQNLDLPKGDLTDAPEDGEALIR